LKIAPRDHAGDFAAPLDEDVIRSRKRTQHDGLVEQVLAAKLAQALAERAAGWLSSSESNASAMSPAHKLF
jgi:hypothetical protein